MVKIYRNLMISLITSKKNKMINHKPSERIKFLFLFYGLFKLMKLNQVMYFYLGEKNEEWFLLRRLQ
jgi:hypothetical protein